MSIQVKKTYKLFIGGKFPRSESGRTFEPAGAKGFNVAMGSRKDLREAVVAARGALPKWCGMTAYNRGQILYRLAEMVATRASSLADEIRAGNRRTASSARKEIDAAGELITFYAGLPDKLQQLLGTQNEVAGPFFNFSTVEPVGVVGAVAPDEPSLLGALAMSLPLLAGGNTVVLLTSEAAPLPGLALGELFAMSDVPGGVINLLAGERSELLPQLASHRDVDGLLVAGPPDAAVSAAAADSVTRVRFADLTVRDWNQARKLGNLHFVNPFVEVKTLWHPVSQ
jgi:acyl-CoA reductase-like NAD-dependent aldehyde dehydrogenase